MMNLFIVILVSFLWLSHTSVFFWGIFWPLHQHTFKKRGRMRYVHIIIVIVSVLLSLTAVIPLQFSEGYGINIQTYYRCDVRGVKDSFYAILLPIDIILIIGLSMLTAIIWRLADVVRNLKKHCKHYIKHFSSLSFDVFFH